MHAIEEAFESLVVGIRRAVRILKDGWQRVVKAFRHMMDELSEVYLRLLGAAVVGMREEHMETLDSQTQAPWCGVYEANTLAVGTVLSLNTSGCKFSTSDGVWVPSEVNSMTVLTDTSDCTYFMEAWEQTKKTLDLLKKLDRVPERDKLCVALGIPTDEEDEI